MANSVKRQDAQIYVYNHKPLDYGVWDNALYTPLEVGAFYREPYMEQMRDNAERDNISAANPLFAENTGLYFVWKHCNPSEFKGVCQYRRRLEFPYDFDFRKAFKDYDAIACVPLNVSVRAQYSGCHCPQDMEILEMVVKGLYPDYADAWDKYINNGTKLYYSAGLVMRTEDFDAYCEWLFKILFKFVEAAGWYSLDDVHKTVAKQIKEGKRRDARGEGYQMQVCGFLQERLMTLYLKRNCKVFEMPYTLFEGLRF